jgi:hypothetical protein
MEFPSYLVAAFVSTTFISAETFAAIFSPQFFLITVCHDLLTLNFISAVI